jgi:hypothetical protein
MSLMMEAAFWYFSQLSRRVEPIRPSKLLESANQIMKAAVSFRAAAVVE